jgi:hypothetical protein
MKIKAVKYHFISTLDLQKKKALSQVIRNNQNNLSITGYKYDSKLFSVNQQISLYYYYHIYYCITRNLKVFLLHLSMMNIKHYLRVFIMIGNV